MDTLQQQLKDLIEDLPLMFRRLRELLLPTSNAYNEVIQQEARFNQNETERLGGRLSFEDAGLVINQVRQAALHLIDRLTAADLRQETTGQRLHDYHRFTCDRVDQSDRFEQLFSAARSQKIHFFYLYGLDLQSHRGLFRRIAFNLEGRLQDYLNPGTATATLTPGRSRALQIELTFDVSRNPDIYKQNILKSLLAALSVRVNEHEPLLEKDIAWLRLQSPALQGLTASDFVCIYIGISEYDWDKELTPQVTRWFIEDFCKVALPADFPAMLFFFGIIYEEDDSAIEQEVEAVVSQSTLVTALPELGMVGARDIGAWFNKYSFVAPSARELKDLKTKHFGQTDEHYMDDVELALRQVIDEYNKNFF